MTSLRETVPAPARAALPASTPLRLALLWSGAALCVAGIAWHRLWQQWAPGRFGELIVLSLFALACAWPLRRYARWSWASALAPVWLCALALFAGPLPVLAVALFGLASVALGGMLAGSALPVALRCACGLALFGGVVGWLLPLPIHTRWTYLVVCVGLIGWARAALLADLRILRVRWTEAVAASPRFAAFAVLSLGLAGTACWLPTMQFDDLAYHLRLPWQLMLEGRYALDPRHQVWALAPWAADVQQAIPQLIAGGEARGPLNALWIAITAAGLWRLAMALRGTPRSAWIAVALYASLPLTAALAGGMQTETPTAALLVWLAWAIVDREPRPGSRKLLAGAALAGGLVGLKLIAAGFALVMVCWAAWCGRPYPAGRWLPVAALIVAAVGASSYAYAGMVSGNPFLPLFNATFDSPYFAAADFDDPRWHAGFGPLLPWRMTFETGRYSEDFVGAAGFGLIALAGAWAATMLRPGLRAIGVVATLLLFLAWVPVQYLRYAFPAMVLLLPALAIAAERIDGRSAAWLLIGVCIANAAFQANGHWMLRTGALKRTVRALGEDAPVVERYAPERLLSQRIRDAGPRGQVLVLDAANPVYADLGNRGLTTAWYAPRMMRDAQAADRDASGRAWLRLLRREGIGDVVVRTASLAPAQAAGLRLAGAERRAVAGQDAQWWRLPAEHARREHARREHARREHAR